MGKDKVENEDLIKYGFPEDIWFHVDKFSSAHVYLRLDENQTIEGIPASVLEDCCQLVKANSNKENNITIVYTPWANLKKTGAMDVGQNEVRKYKIDKRKNEIVNRLNKTKKESYPDLAGQRAQRDREIREKQKKSNADMRDQEKYKLEEAAKKKEMESYDSIMVSENMTSNRETQKTYQELEDDFIDRMRGRNLLLVAATVISLFFVQQSLTRSIPAEKVPAARIPSKDENAVEERPHVEEAAVKNDPNKPVRAAVEVGRRLNALPKVKDFLLNEIKVYAPEVTVKWIPGHNPEIAFYNSEEKEIERLDLAKYDQAGLHKLLQERGFVKHTNL
ncbi:hypothetical protein PROFUN_06334 [Planoprotostelium fungivorum]|uniref:NFACT RNA-binding domain-containing protein n=1 Tax=Planoprotostelium fungivorum TaxID=1890364 RepID=A0A2P6NP64_9EUKA|nr:hypothetical protein PROFUN_06334 [Planoprotostelium fungivorum]